MWKGGEFVKNYTRKKNKKNTSVASTLLFLRRKLAITLGVIDIFESRLKNLV